MRGMSGVSKRRRGGGGGDGEVGAGGATSCSMYAASLLYGAVGEEECEVSAMRYFRPRTAMETDLAAQCLARAVRGVRRRPGRAEQPVAHAPLHYARLEVVCSPDELDADLGAMRACGESTSTSTSTSTSASSEGSVPSVPTIPSVIRTRMDVDSLFVRCVHSKGWVTCVACGAVQWPPNREKHLAKCPGLLGHIHRAPVGGVGGVTGGGRNSVAEVVEAKV